MTIRSFADKTPQIAGSAWVDESALVIGDVSIGADSSVWPMCVIRGDVNSIVIGERSNIQDASILHVNHESDYNPGSIVIIGNDVTVGHRVTLHGCTVEDTCLIGMGAIIMDDAVVSRHCVIGAGSLVPQGKTLDSGYLYVGTPVRRIRKLAPAQIAQLEYSARHYVENKNQHCLPSRSG